MSQCIRFNVGIWSDHNNGDLVHCSNVLLCISILFLKMCQVLFWSQKPVLDKSPVWKL